MSDPPPPPPPSPSDLPPASPSQTAPADGAPADGAPAEGWATLGTGEAVELATAGRRLGARLIDGGMLLAASVVLIFVVAVIAYGAAGGEGAASEDAAVLLALLLGVAVSVVGIALYEVSMIATRGQTLGKMATKVKVVRSDTGLVPGWGKAAGRYAAPAGLNLVPMVGWVLGPCAYIALLWDDRRQGWHDKAAGTLVVKA